MEAIMRLNMAIDKFRNSKYDTLDFHKTLESIIKSITEEDNSKLRAKLLEFESELELIDFTVDDSKQRSEYLLKIDEVNKWIVSYL